MHTDFQYYINADMCLLIITVFITVNYIIIIIHAQALGNSIAT